MAVLKTNWVVNLRSRKHFVALLVGCAIAGPTLFADPAAAGCNSGNNANTDLLSSANCQAGATGNGSTAVGAGAFASGGNGTALGASAVADGLNSTSAGTNASSLVEGATSVGAFAGLLVGSGGTGIYSTSIGAGVNPGLNPAAVTSAQAFGDFSIAIGGGNTGNAGAIANGVGSVAIGNQSSVNGDRSTAIGFGSAVIGNDGTAIGSGSIAVLRAVAAGNGAFAGGSDTIAIGTGATAVNPGSAAFGNGAVATRGDQQVFGTAANTYTTPGITSVASKAAQSGPTEIVTSDAAGNLATTPLSSLGIASTADLSAINARLDDLTTRSNKAFTGVAMAFAMAGVPTLLPGEKVAMTVNYGTFEGANGLALNAAFRLTNDMQLTGGIGYGPDENIAGGRVGLRVAW